MTQEDVDILARHIVEENTITTDEETKKKYAHFFSVGYNMNNTLHNYEDALLFAFVHGGTKHEENKDPEMLKKNFNELLDALKYNNIKNHGKI